MLTLPRKAAVPVAVVLSACLNLTGISTASKAAEDCTIQHIRDCTRHNPVAAESILKAELARVLLQFGEFYRTAPAPFRDQAKARDYFEQAVVAGERWALVSLADMLAKGEGGAADPAQAKALLERAQDAGLVKAALNALGVLYRTAPAPFRDQAKARDYFEQAAAAGEPWALISLADMLAKGEGGAVDPAQAKALLEKAQEAGLVKAAFYALGVLSRTASSPFRDLAKAREYFEQASAAGDRAALISLGDMLTNGEGGAADPEQAQRLLAGVVNGPGLAATYVSLISVEIERSSSPSRIAAEVLPLLDQAYSLDSGVGLNAFALLDMHNKTALVQAVLKRRGLYAGQLDGLLTKATLRAIASFCQERRIYPDCRREAMPRSLLDEVLKASPTAEAKAN